MITAAEFNMRNRGGGGESSLIREERRKKPKFYWDVVFQETVERPASRHKMTRSRAKSVLNVNINEDENFTTRTVYRAFRKLSYPLELMDYRDKNKDGFTQVYVFRVSSEI